MRTTFLLIVIFFVAVADGLAQFDQAYGIHPKLPNSTHVSLVDIDGDGADEVMSCSVMTKELAFFKATEEQVFQFNSVSRNLYGASEIYTLDLDSDGDQDVLAYEELEDQLVWFENDSETYTKHVIAEVPNGFALSHYDLDNDGDQDLFYAASQMNQLLMFEQTAAGEFADSSVLFEVSDIRSLHWEDIDLDGDDDLVSGGEVIGIFENLDNQLMDPIAFGGGIDNLRYENVDCYDFNQDGQLDIISKSVDNSSLFVFYQGLDLDFSSTETIASDDFLRDWCLMDIDGNGFEDVVIGADGDVVLSYLPINESGLAGVRMAINDLGVDEVHHLAVGDYNGDGETDLVISDLSQIVFCEQEGDALVRRGDMSGKALVEYPIQLIDADDDGDQDLLLNNVDGDQLLFNSGQGDFYENGEQLSTANRNSILQDLNNDGLADLIRYELFWTDLEVKFQILEGTFGEATVLPIEYWGGDFNFTFFDVDQNGSLDIVASRLSNPICEVFLNNSGFSETDHIFYDVPILDPITVAMGDVNNDGYLDMMTCDESSTYVRWGGTDLLLGDAIQINGTGGASRIQLVDLDLDGDLDFIGYTTTGIAYQLINDESTNWPMSVIDSSTGSNEVEFCLADFNGDGFPDLAHAEPTNFQVELRYNNQEGGFLPPEIPFAGYTPSHVSAADLNGDGSQDLVIGVMDQVTGILGLMNTSLSGCTDPLACNFNSEATVDGGGCCYDCGCTDPNALNYNSMATCADGSCQYEISINVFDDLDLNAEMNGTEYMLHDILVHVEPAGVDFITDLNGNFTLVASEGESFTLEVETTPVFPFHTTTDPFPVLVDQSTAEDGVLLGIAKLEPIPEISIELWAPGLSGLCSAPENFVFLIQNQGNSVLNGTAVVEYSSLLSGLSLDFEHEVLNDSIFQIEFFDLLPGAVILDNFSLITPEAEFLGTFLDIEVSVLAFSPENQEAQDSDELDFELLCAYDPNDKRVSPEGYEEPHFIAVDQELEYTVRFQNTGNSPAINVVVEDTISEYLDMGTLDIKGASHNMQVEINAAERLIRFVFPEIMLPDSTCCLEESQGFVAFAMAPLVGLADGTEINNDAYIYFDNNEAIITNETWSTIMVCSDEMSAIQSDYDLQICEDTEFEFSNDSPWIEEYTWNIQEEPFIGDSLILVESPAIGGAFSISLTTSNPICESFSSLQFELVNNNLELNPDLMISIDGNLMSTADFEAYQWYLYNEPIEGATMSSYIGTEIGDYYVVVTDEFGCQEAADEVVFVPVNIDNLEFAELLVYPNPVSEQLTIDFPFEIQTAYELLDGKGALITSGNLRKGMNTIDMSALAAGIYFLKVDGAVEAIKVSKK